MGFERGRASRQGTGGSAHRRVDGATVTGVVPCVGRSGKGSAAEVRFTGAAGLEAARFAVRAAAIAFGNRPRVWLDCVRTPAELRSSRIVHRAVEAMTDSLVQRGLPADGIEKAMVPKTIRKNGGVIAYIAAGKLQFSAAGREAFPPDDRLAIASFAEGE